MALTYLDYNASTPIHPRVAAVMQAALQGPYGNPSSSHWAGAPARALLEKARGQVAALLGCHVDEIIFLSGGSEANNLALKGTLFTRDIANAQVITTRIEHPAVLEPCRFLEKLGATCTYLPVDSTGRVDPDDLRRAITPRTALISIMHANNEVGTVQPIEACARIAREHGITFHTDAAQSVGKIATRVDDLGVDMLSIAGHKLYAPKGVGALYVRRGVQLEPLIHGAGHERGRRAGTESVMLCAALGEACELSEDLSWTAETQALRDQLWEGLRARWSGAVTLNGHQEQRLPNTLNVSFAGVIGSELLARMPSLAASTGSACHSGRVEISPVLAAMGVSEERGAGAVRFSLERGTTAQDIENVLEQISAAC